MSYDLTFLRKGDDQTWEQAFEALEAEDAADGGGPPSAEAWARIVGEAREILGDVTVRESAESFELEHDATGIDLSLYAEEAGISVPYWYKGSRAEAVVGLIYRLGAVVERHTGLLGYDGQVELTVAEAARQPQRAVSVFDEVARSFASRGYSSPSNDDDARPR